MQSKIEAAAIAQAANIETWIVNGLNDNFISVEVVRDVDYSIVRSVLNEYESNDTIQYGFTLFQCQRTNPKMENSA